MSVSEAIISLQGVDIYQKDSLVLNKVNLTVNKGEFVYLIGKTGSGKSSLLKSFYADITPENGTAEVAGFNLMKLKKSQIPYLRRKIGIVFQDFQLLTDRNINENLTFVLKATGWKGKKEIKNRIQEVLSKVGLNTKGFKFPHELSGGEQQRVVIARALLNDPDLILADEPTGNLDPQTTSEILALLVEISNNNKAVIMATHDYETIRNYASRTITCENGVIKDSKAVSSNAPLPVQ
ncbi:MAG: cell division transport system ATP-binding protein [Flavobacteriales bacterium]|jgi:cell division transport system ATP-binding protein